MTYWQLAAAILEEELLRLLVMEDTELLIELLELERTEELLVVAAELVSTIYA